MNNKTVPNIKILWKQGLHRRNENSHALNKLKKNRTAVLRRLKHFMKFCCKRCDQMAPPARNPPSDTVMYSYKVLAIYEATFMEERRHIHFIACGACNFFSGKLLLVLRVADCPKRLLLSICRLLGNAFEVDAILSQYRRFYVT